MVNTKSLLNKLKAKWDEGKFVCVGLDRGNFEFDKTIIDATFDLVCAYKLNSAFYEEKGVKGWQALKETCDYIRDKHPDIFLLLDSKRGDVENTNQAYVKSAFDILGVDGVTVNPYLGKEALKPFLDRIDEGIFVLVKTSNSGAGEFQDLSVGGKPLYQVVAEHVKDWNTNGNLAVVVGATYPDEIKKVREVVGEMPILVPGIGAQGGDLEQTIKNGISYDNQGLIISSSRTILDAIDPRKAVQDLNSRIQEIIKNV